MKAIARALLRKKRQKEPWFKYIMSVSHLWLGLLSSIILFIVCLTGSIYAFKTQIENIINSDIAYSSPQKKAKAPLDSLLFDFNSRFGEATKIIEFVDGKSTLITSFSKNSLGVSAYYNPYTGKYLGTKSEHTEAFFSFILELHRFLLAGDLGKTINGTAVLILLYMLLSGFTLWLPKKIKHLKKGLLIKWKARFYRLNYDLHKVLGFYSILLLSLIAITGLYVSFHWVKNAIIVGFGGDSIIISEDNLAIKKELSSSFNALLNDLNKEVGADTTEINKSISQLCSITDSVFNFPGNKSILLPNENIQNYTFIKENDQNSWGIIVPEKITFSKKGKIRMIEKFDTLALHEQFKAIAKPLHTGEIMGLPSIILYFLISLIGCSLPITGFIIWWKKTKKA